MTPFALLIRSTIRLSITFFILYLIFTNFGTFLLIIGSVLLIGGYLVSKLAQKLKNNGAHFKFNQQDFKAHGNFNFNDFNQQNFNGGGFSQQMGEVPKAKEFFGFTQDPTKDEIKKKYKELARKYHPDINDQDDTLMKDLNHYKDVLMKVYGDK